MPYRGVTVGTASAQQVQYNHRRTSLLIRNIGTNPVYVSEDNRDITGQGMLLNQYDYLALIEADGDDPRVALYLQSTGGNSDVRIAEQYKQET